MGCGSLSASVGTEGCKRELIALDGALVSNRLSCACASTAGMRDLPSCGAAGAEGKEGSCAALRLPCDCEMYALNIGQMKTFFLK